MNRVLLKGTLARISKLRSVGNIISDIKHPKWLAPCIPTHIVKLRSLRLRLRDLSVDDGVGPQGLNLKVLTGAYSKRWNM